LFKTIKVFFRYLRQKKVAPQKRQNLQLGLLEESTLEINYMVLIFGSCAIATFGLISNSSAVIIGAMLIAPLMFPIRGLAFGALEGDLSLFRKGLQAIAVGTIFSIALALAIGSLIGLPEFGSEVISRSKPNLIDLGIAVAAGGISGFAKIQPKVSGTLAGTAIAVALMPPICVIGLGLSHGDWSLSLGATLLYLTNLLGITLSCMLTFLITGYTPLEDAKRPLMWTLGLTTLLVIPLGISFIELTRQAHLEASLKEALLNRTITFQRVELVDIDTDWLTNPPEVYLTVRSREVLTPKQVRLLEEFVAKEMGRDFTLVFSVSQVEEVRRENPEQSDLQPTP
jgi:uncharacterized hydrophobic protein (TIGR00271 family)